MSKNFEEEYKQYIQEHTPDLWKRIEAGLSEKKVPTKRKVIKYMSVAAAALFMCILIPVINFNVKYSENAKDEFCEQMDMEAPKYSITLEEQEDKIAGNAKENGGTGAGALADLAESKLEAKDIAIDDKKQLMQEMDRLSGDEENVNQAQQFCYVEVKITGVVAWAELGSELAQDGILYQGMIADGGENVILYLQGDDRTLVVDTLYNMSLAVASKEAPYDYIIGEVE